MRRVAVTSALIVLAALISGSQGGCGPSQQVQDSRDQQRLREIFGVPDGSQLVSWRGYPSSVGFGQREGLSLAATWRIPEAAEADFAERSLSEGWRDLPVPDSVIACIPFQGLTVPVDAGSGIYICRTAGDNVLHAPATVPVEEAARVNDLIMGVYDRRTGLLHVEVRSGY